MLPAGIAKLSPTAPPTNSASGGCPAFAAEGHETATSVPLTGKQCSKVSAPTPVTSTRTAPEAVTRSTPVRTCLNDATTVAGPANPAKACRPTYATPSAPARGPKKAPLLPA